MPKVSVLVSTFRPGGLDITFAGMRDQIFKDFEVILVDRRYEIRKAEVQELAEIYDLNLIHVPEHRRNGQWAAIGSAWNTGIALAKGEIILFLQDWAYAPPGWLEAHMDCQVNVDRRYVLSPYVYMNLPPLLTKQRFVSSTNGSEDYGTFDTNAILNGDILYECATFSDGLFEGSWVRDLTRMTEQQDPRILSRGHAVPANWVHIKNESVSRSVVWELNGLDERLDCGKGPLDTDLWQRLRLSNTELYWEPSGVTFCPNPRLICRSMPWGDMDVSIHNRWSFRDGERYVAARVAMIESGQGTWKASNPSSMEALAQELEPWRYNKMLRVSRDVGDQEYWGFVPQPTDV